MSRPWQVWTAFALSLGLALGVMAWLSGTILELERARETAARQSVLEENVRLALWRLDSALTPILARESARAPADSPAGDAGFVSLHFLVKPGGAVTSPQAPDGPLPGKGGPERAETGRTRLARLREVLSGADLDAIVGARERAPENVQRQERAPAASGQESVLDPVQVETVLAQSSAVQQAKNAAEWQARAANTTDNRQVLGQMANPGESPSEGVLHPLWSCGELLLVRRDRTGTIQGSWLDWPGLKAWLLSRIRDLLPHADLAPSRSDEPDPGSRRLASLPVEIVPGPAPPEPVSGLSPLRLSILVAWGCVSLAVAAVVTLLRGAVSLSERRATFVSAVTHELRTPLTTFRMYAEMLAEGMVADEEKRRRYLETLDAEARRLSHLVENVLAYAGLERNRHSRRMEIVAVRDLLERSRGRLEGRAAQVGMHIQLRLPDDALDGLVLADPGAVDQILFNLVDNACKYAASTRGDPIAIEAALDGRRVALRVSDRGRGIQRDVRRRLFRPFSRSAREAAGSAPGVGLGLALSRRLARAMGGDLRLDTEVKEGARFVLMLRRAHS